MYGGQKTTCVSPFCPFTVWVLGNELRPQAWQQSLQSWFFVFSLCKSVVTWVYCNTAGFTLAFEIVIVTLPFKLSRTKSRVWVFLTLQLCDLAGKLHLTLTFSNARRYCNKRVWKCRAHPAPALLIRRVTLLNESNSQSNLAIKAVIAYLVLVIKLPFENSPPQPF